MDFMHILGQKEAIWNTIFSIFLSDGGASQTSRGPGKLFPLSFIQSSPLALPLSNPPPSMGLHGHLNTCSSKNKQTLRLKHTERLPLHD